MFMVAMFTRLVQHDASGEGDSGVPETIGWLGRIRSFKAGIGWYVRSARVRLFVTRCILGGMGDCAF